MPPFTPEVIILTKEKSMVQTFCNTVFCFKEDGLLVLSLQNNALKG